MDYFTYLRGMEYMPQNQYMNFGNNLNTQATPWVLDFQNKSTQYNLNNLITGIKNSIENEAEDETMYAMLAKLAPNDEQRDVILDIQSNEMLHGKIFKKIFNELTGVILQDTVSNTSKMSTTNTNYMDTLKEAFMGELMAIERYRELLAYAPNMEIYSMIMYVMTDEIRHALKYNYLMMLNK